MEEPAQALVKARDRPQHHGLRRLHVAGPHRGARRHQFEWFVPVSYHSAFLRV